MTTNYAGTIAALSAPLSESLARIEAARMNAEAYVHHPLYNGACAEIQVAVDECDVAQEALTKAIVSLRNLHERLKPADPEPEPILAAPYEAEEPSA